MPKLSFLEKEGILMERITLFHKTTFIGTFGTINTISKNCNVAVIWRADLQKQKLERKEKETEGNNKVRFFIYGFKINNLVGESLFFVAVFILESLEGILIAKLSIELGLVVSEVASLFLFSY